MSSAFTGYESRVSAADEAPNAASATGYKFIENLLILKHVLR